MKFELNIENAGEGSDDEHIVRIYGRKRTVSYDMLMAIDYGTLTELEMIGAIAVLFEIADENYNEEDHYHIICRITYAAFRLKYEKVKDRLRAIYPLSFPEIEQAYPNMPNQKWQTVDPNLKNGGITPVMPVTDEQKKQVAELNNLAKTFREK